MTNILSSSIVDAGTPFVVTDALKDTVLLPGTIGFSSYILGPEVTCPNVVFHKIVVIQRGKTGKPRMESTMAVSPIFTVKDVPLDFYIKGDEERKSYVDVLPSPAIRKNYQDQSVTYMIGHLYAKMALLKALASASFPADSPLVSAAGTNRVSIVGLLAPEVQDMFPDRFLHDIERYFGDMENDPERFRRHINNDRFKQTASQAIVTLETALTVPMINFKIKSLQVLTDALAYLKSLFSSKAADEFKNIKDIRLSISTTQTQLHSCKNALNSLLDKRLSVLRSDRDYAEFEN